MTDRLPALASPSHLSLYDQARLVSSAWATATRVCYGFLLPPLVLGFILGKPKPNLKPKT